jgi:SAM-dependent methyltransferase
MHQKNNSSLSSKCNICGGANIQYRFLIQGHSLYQCANCDFMFLNPPPSDEFLDSLQSPDDSTMSNDEQLRSEMKQATARLYLEQLVRYYGKQQGNLLEIGCENGDFLLAAKKAGFTVKGVEVSESAAALANARLGEQSVICGNIETMDLPEASFDVCALFDVLEHVRDPIGFLNKIHRILVPGGVLFLVLPSLDSWSARLMKNNWIEFRPEHFHYFNKETVQHALFKSGFREMRLSSNFKYLQLEYIKNHFRKHPVPFYSKAIQTIAKCLPSTVKNNNIKYSTSRMNVLCRKSEVKETPVLSIIVPAYNEATTIGILMRSLLDLETKGVQKEIIIVESNSTDGTRSEVQKFSSVPGVTVVLEDKPRGKGYAVRTGLEHASGDFIMIQDADLEYDLNDYEQLLQPLLSYQKAFVLGSRHLKGWKMRQFENAHFTAFVMNLGQKIFKGLLNIACGQHLNDPFTMYKVFRRDCLFGLTFTANRFDFDFEIVIKLLRKGYDPLEIPVNYKSRSFEEGKKISFTRDPLLWIRALIKYRFEKLYKIKYEKKS